MSRSLISNEHECYVCGQVYDLHRHHIFYGTANRRLSENYGCWCWLCGWHHNLSDVGVHFNKKLDLRLKKVCQEAWEREYGGRSDFIAVFGRSWL